MSDMSVNTKIPAGTTSTTSTLGKITDQPKNPSKAGESGNLKHLADVALEDVLSSAKKITSNIESGKENISPLSNSESVDAPELPNPNNTELSGMTMAARFTYLMAKLQKETGQLTLEELHKHLQSILQEKTEQAAKVGPLVNEVTQLDEKATQAVEEAKKATEAAETAATKADSAQTKYNTDVKTLFSDPALLKLIGYDEHTDLQGMDESQLSSLVAAAKSTIANLKDPQEMTDERTEYVQQEDAKGAQTVANTQTQKTADQEKLEKVLQTIVQDETELSSAKQESSDAQAKAVQLTTNANTLIKDTATKIDSLRSQMNQLDAQGNIQLQSVQNNIKSSMALMTKLMGLLSNLISKNSDSQIEADQKANEAMFKENQEKISEQMKKQEKDQEKAESTRKGLGIFSKIFGPIMAAIGIVAAIATGGVLAVVIASVAAAVTVIDLAVEAGTGTSYMSVAMEAVTKNVIMPTIDFLAKNLYGPALMAMGVSKEKAAKAAKIIASIVVAKAIIGGMLLAGVGIGASGIASATTVALTNAAAKLATVGVGVVAKIAVVVAGLGGTIAQQATSLVAADTDNDAKHAEANVEEYRADQKMIQQMAQQLSEYAAKNMEFSQQINEILFSMMGKTAQATRAILRG